MVDIEFCVWEFFSSSIWNPLSFHFIYLFFFPVEQSTDSFSAILLKVIYFSSPANFKVFSLSLFFSSLTMICLGMAFSVITLPGIRSTSFSTPPSFIYLRKSFAIITSNIASTLFSLILRPFHHILCVFYVHFYIFSFRFSMFSSDVLLYYLSFQLYVISFPQLTMFYFSILDFSFDLLFASQFSDEILHLLIFIVYSMCLSSILWYLYHLRVCSLFFFPWLSDKSHPLICPFFVFCFLLDWMPGIIYEKFWDNLRLWVMFSSSREDFLWFL